MSKKSFQSKVNLNNSKHELQTSYDLKSYPASWYSVCWIIYLCYCYAAFVPTGAVWGIHFIAYIPVGVKIILLVAGGLLLMPETQHRLYLAIVRGGRLGMSNESQKLQILPAAIIAALCLILFRTFTMKTDIYGDHIYILKNYDQNSIFDWNWILNIFNPQLNLNENLQGYSEALTIAVHRVVAHVFSISIEASYETVSEICGALFIFVWLLFVQKITKENDPSQSHHGSSRPLRIALILLGMFAGSIQVFFGHVENYSFGILTFTLFLLTLYFYIEEKIGTLPFVLIYLVAFKAHIIAILFIPAFLVALAYRFRERLPKLQSLFTWHAILTVVIMPTLIVGLGSYIFIFHSWNEPYASSSGDQLEQSFLPIVSFPPPIDHYSLWSPYHIADFINLLLLTSAPIVIILANLMIFNRKNIIWSQPRVIIFGLAVLFPFLFFIALNPQLSPVRDWDIYTLLFPPLLFFAAMLMIQSGVRPFVTSWIAQSVVFGVIFTSTLVAVNCSTNELQLRLMDAGAYTYHSYYVDSKFIETRSFSMDESSNPALIHLSTIVHELSLSPAPGIDHELADMMSFLARYHGIAGNDSAAISWEKMARNTDTSNQKYVIDLAAFYVHSNELSEGSRVLSGIMKHGVDTHDTDNSYVDEIATIMAQLAARYSRAGDDSSTQYWALEASKTEPENIKFIYDLADYYMQTNRPLKALGEFRSIQPDSLSVEALMEMSLTEANAFSPDSGLKYLYRAKAMAPNNRSIDSLILEMKR